MKGAQAPSRPSPGLASTCVKCRAWSEATCWALSTGLPGPRGPAPHDILEESPQASHGCALPGPRGPGSDCLPVPIVLLGVVEGAGDWEGCWGFDPEPPPHSPA